MQPRSTLAYQRHRTRKPRGMAQPSKQYPICSASQHCCRRCERCSRIVSKPQKDAHVNVEAASHASVMACRPHDGLGRPSRVQYAQGLREESDSDGTSERECSRDEEDADEFGLGRQASPHDPCSWPPPTAHRLERLSRLFDACFFIQH